MIFPSPSSRITSLDAYERHSVSDSKFNGKGQFPHPSTRNQEVIAIILVDFKVAHTNLDIHVRVGSFRSKDALGVISVELDHDRRLWVLTWTTRGVMPGSARFPTMVVVFPDELTP